MRRRATSPVDAHTGELGITKDPESNDACEFCVPDKQLVADAGPDGWALRGSRAATLATPHGHN